MDAERRTTVEEIFDAALELPEASRDAFLDEACRGDDELRDEVEDLLAAHRRAEGILDRGPGRVAADLLDLAGGTGPDLPGDRTVGPYRVVDELGRGGMGVVYLAERSDGHFRRRVALKVIPGRETPGLRARMVAERQILASLDHPNIAGLLDGGVTDDGRPFLVMEYVAGLPVDVYCDRMRLSVRERLELFVTIARAVEHAHRNLVVHRDLKPSNILVNSDGEVKLLDFGIAKLLNPALVGVEAPVTLHDTRLLTPQFASPEQLRGEVLTTASDVYSLGLILYRLLTGVPPFPVADPSITAILSAVLAGDPERPSVQALRDREIVHGDGSKRELSAESRATERHTVPRRLARTLKGDLDAIALKALRPEPARRYGSAEALAQDLERFLAGEPVQARKGSRIYRLGKLVRRHRAVAGAGVTAVVTLAVGGGVAAWQAGVARQERDEAQLARVQAEEVSDFLMELFRIGDPLSGDGGAVTARDLVGRGLQRADALAGQPEV
ncbi:MAG TPA: serine/threonine-protein kinase, partial [Longimicrobiales bacterium]|nr:serine/threonine-protein kinase [Longimicrobiales bacterium]